MNKSRFLLILSLLAAPGFGCTSDTGEGPGTINVAAPHVSALSTYEASVGTLVEVYGSDFLSASEGEMFLQFRGTYTAEDGATTDVDSEFEAVAVNGGTLRWTSFGPYQVPFGQGRDVAGTFEGTVGARAVLDDGTSLEDIEPIPVSFRVKPSLIVRELQPVTANCGGPVQRALGGAGYRVAVEAVGFEPESFTYTISFPTLGLDPISVRHAAGGRFDSVGEDGDFVFPAVPADVLSYGAILTVQSTSSDGEEFVSAFAIGVHRPLEVYYNGNVAVAEIFAPVPVSSCIPGGVNGRSVSYNESSTETRTRSYSVNWNENWLSSHTVASSSSQTVGLNETNGVGFATTDGESFTWSLGGEVNSSFGLSEMVKVGVKATFGVSGTTSRSRTNSQSRTEGLSASETTTDTNSVSESMGGSTGETFSWSVSSAQTVGNGFSGTVIADTFGVFYRQTVRLRRSAALVAYNQCGAAAVVADVEFDDYEFAPDLALGSSCPPLPESNLPQAECLISPCAGE